ncbi:folliculin-interacting protein 2-like [Clytia hemisphaerica]
MFSFLFNSRQNKNAQKKEENDWKKDLEDYQRSPNLPVLDPSKIRVLIFKESSAKKTLMFDSDALVMLPTQPNSPICPLSKTKKAKSDPFPSHSSQKYQITKAKQDVKMLGEMIFGSVAMVYKGSILKVHLIRSPPQLLMTKVFALRSRSAGVNFCDSELSSCNSLSRPVDVASTPSLSSSSASMPASPTSDTEINRSFSTPVNMRNKKSSFLNPHNSISLLAAPSWSMSDLDTLSLSSSFLSLNGGSPHDSQAGSFRYRFSRSKKTSLDSPVWRSRTEQSEELRSVYKQQPKIGVGIIFNLWDNAEDNRAFQDFFFSHYTLFEAQLQAFRVKIEKSFYLRQKFLDTAVEALEGFREDVLRLCYTPRIIEPVWLNLTSTVERKQKECASKFFNTFLEIYDMCENKETSYFLSNLMTAVLTHHLSWINTVISCEKNSKKCRLNKHASSTIDILARCHPYNPLWAQICDLYGCLGSPFKLARTVIVGKNIKLVNKILQFLTYFIRCCEVQENFIGAERPKDFSNRQSGSNWNDSLSSSSSAQTNIQNWFERSCSIITSQNVDPFKEFKNYNHLDALDERDEILTPRTSDRNIIEHLKSMNLDTTKCYCVFLQALNKVSDLRSYVNMEDIKKKELNITNDSGKPGLVASKSCMICRTLEKGMFEQFCDKCKLDLQKSSIEVVNTVCLHCVKRLENASKCQNFIENSTCSCGSGSTKDCICNGNMKQTQVCPKKPSFICYCCAPSTYGDLELDIKADTSCGSLTDLDLTPRPRKSSDPIDVVPMSKTNSKFGTMRSSTNSHDSGTELEHSEGFNSCSGDSDSCFTRADSMSSQGVDSDYCSVESEQLASTLIENSLLLMSNKDIGRTEIPDKNICRTELSGDVCRTDVPDTEHYPHPPVTKSLSTTTLKSSLALDFDDTTDTNTDTDVNTIEDHSQDTLTLDLDELRLKELSLPRSKPKSHRKHQSARYSWSDTPSFGKSMLAGYTENYLGDFVLQGCKSIDQAQLANDLLRTVKYSVLDEEINDAVCIVADTDNWTCEVRGMSKRIGQHNQNTSFEPYTTEVFASNIISSMVESIKELCSLNMPPNFCLLHVEEQLRDLFNKGKVFAEYSNSNDHDESAKKSFMRVFGYHSTDIELLNAVGGTLTVPVAQDETLYAV